MANNKVLKICFYIYEKFLKEHRLLPVIMPAEMEFQMLAVLKTELRKVA